MKRVGWIVLGIVVLLVAGLTRLQLDADIFNLLPRDSRMVRSLQLYQQDFGSSNELVLLLRTEDAASTTAAAERLAQALQESSLAARVIWRNPFRGNPEELGELLAYLWLNQPAEAFAALADRFTDERMPTLLDQTLERMAVSFQPLEVARLSMDPFELGAVAGQANMPIPSGGDDPFASSDGTARILAVASPFESAGFFRLRGWVGDVDAWLIDWQSASSDIPGLTVGVTGNPAFVVESGWSLLRDVSSAALGTMIIVALLFWLVHRRWRPLLWLITLLTGVLAATALVGGAIFGTLNAVSLGFAAILLGLAADYGLILYQEMVAHPGRRVSDYRAAVAPAILWSAVTTAGAFFMIGRSSLPGLTQLGVLVGAGVLIAAVVMLLAYLPLVGMRGEAPGRMSPAAPGIFRLDTRTALAVTALVVGLTLAVLSQRQPALDMDAESMSLQSGSARSVLNDVRASIGGFNEDMWLVMTGADESAVLDQLATATPILDQAVSARTLNSYNLPAQLWPRPAEQSANRDTLERLAARGPAASEAAATAGFADESMALTQSVFDAWSDFRDHADVVWPSTPGARWIMRQFTVQQPGRMAVLGRLQTSDAASHDTLLALEEELHGAGGGQLVSWSLLADSLMVVMNRDIGRVLIPMTIALILLLIVAFRSVGEVVLSMASLTISLGILLSIMALLDWSWNLMNIMALPMLFGAGVDYGLHVQFALRRYEGDAARARNTVGRAILLCAASTAAGFATLGFASNAGIATLGRVCATGIVVTSLVSVFLLPAWWRIMPMRHKKRANAT